MNRLARCAMLLYPARWRRRYGNEVIPGSGTRVTVDAVSPNRASAMIPGLFAGLAIAGIIAIVRRCWQPAQDEEIAVPHHSAVQFSGARFRRLAIWLAAAGAAGGTFVALVAPAHYVSDTLLSFDSANPNRMAILIGDASGSTHDLSWQQVESDGMKTNAFRIQYVADEPVRARAAVQDMLGDIDRAVTSLHADVRMNVIDPPVQPSHSEGIGWWAVAIGTLSGVVLAFLISLMGRMGGWFVANGPDAMADASIH